MNASPSKSFRVITEFVTRCQEPSAQPPTTYLPECLTFRNKHLILGLTSLHLTVTVRDHQEVVSQPYCCQQLEYIFSAFSSSLDIQVNCLFKSISFTLPIYIYILVTGVALFQSTYIFTLHEVHTYISNMCGVIRVIFEETYELWDFFLLGLGTLLARLGL